MSYPDGSRVVSDRVIEVRFGLMGLTFTYGEGKKKGSFRYLVLVNIRGRFSISMCKTLRVSGEEQD